MGGGASAAAECKQQQVLLDKRKAELRNARSQAEQKEKRIQSEELLQRQAAEATARVRDEARERDRLQTRLAESRSVHDERLAWQHGVLHSEHSDALHSYQARQENQVQVLSEDHTALQMAMARAEVEQDHMAFCEKLEGAKVEIGHLFTGEQQRVAIANAELSAAHAEVRHLRQVRDGEHAAAQRAREELNAERRSAQRKDELKMVEVRECNSEIEALQDAHHGLEAQERSLRHELNRVSYAVGQRDHEHQVKSSELQEVRQSMSCIQDEMDGVNAKLREQCGRVQRVESSLRLSRDLNERTRGAREMLRESHAVLAQLCGLLEQERSRREQCSQGLRQQRVRTELLLQLLQHFKNRTQDLAPQTLLGQTTAAQPQDIYGILGDTGSFGGGGYAGACVDPSMATSCGWGSPGRSVPAASLQPGGGQLGSRSPTLSMDKQIPPWSQNY